MLGWLHLLGQGVPAVNECWPTSRLSRKGQNRCTQDILGSWGKEREETVGQWSGMRARLNCELWLLPWPLMLFLNSLHPWIPSCTFLFFFFGCMGPEFLIWECWYGMDRDRTCRSKVKNAHDKGCPWGFGEIEICHRQRTGRCLSWGYLDVWEMAASVPLGLHAVEEAKATRHW